MPLEYTSRSILRNDQLLDRTNHLQERVLHLGTKIYKFKQQIRDRYFKMIETEAKCISFPITKQWIRFIHSIPHNEKRWLEIGENLREVYLLRVKKWSEWHIKPWRVSSKEWKTNSRIPLFLSIFTDLAKINSQTCSSGFYFVSFHTFHYSTLAYELYLKNMLFFIVTWRYIDFYLFGKRYWRKKL